MFMKRMFAVTLTATVLGQSIAYAGQKLKYFIGGLQVEKQNQ